MAFRVDIRDADFYLDKTLRMLEVHPTDRDKVVFKGSYTIPLRVGNEWFVVKQDVNISTATDLDTGVVQPGRDYFVYACDTGSLVFKISLNSTFPAGFNADNSRKIGGFHTLCANVGTISGHPLSGYVAGDILPASVWCLRHRAASLNNAGLVYDERTGLWVQIYLASDDGAGGVQSVYNAVILDTINWMDIVDRGGAVKMRLLSDNEFQVVARGSNEETNIQGSVDPVTTGGHVDTAGRRMISHIGCEDCCGAMWQWLRDQSFRVEGSHTHIENTAPVYTQNATTNATDLAAWAWYDLPGAKGSIYRQGTYGDVKLRAGGPWFSGATAGSRARDAGSWRWNANAAIGGRFCARSL